MSLPGICAFSCHQRWRIAGPMDAAAFYRHARELGAQGVQAPLRGADPKALRALVEETGGYYEGDLQLPRDESGLAAFEAGARATRAAGATVARAVLSNGRRYEAFKSLAEF